jgi:RNA polymerase sigma-70 factor (ECF subfamily)
MISDEELMHQTAKGKLAAFNEIVLRYQHSAWSLASRFLNDTTEAQDIAQEAFLRIFKAAPRYRPTASFNTYLYRIIVRLCIDTAQKKRDVVIEEISEFGCQNPNPAQQMIDIERREAVRKEIRYLPPRQRAAIILKEYDEMSYGQIAEIMHTTPKTVERLLARARDTLRKELKKK